MALTNEPNFKPWLLLNFVKVLLAVSGQQGTALIQQPTAANAIKFAAVDD